MKLSKLVNHHILILIPAASFQSSLYSHGLRVCYYRLDYDISFLYNVICTISLLHEIVQATIFLSVHATNYSEMLS